jgi:hypothetical protein
MTTKSSATRYSRTFGVLARSSFGRLNKAGLIFTQDAVYIRTSEQTTDEASHFYLCTGGYTQSTINNQQSTINHHHAYCQLTVAMKSSDKSKTVSEDSVFQNVYLE